jgi:hypothetical protein
MFYLIYVHHFNYQEKELFGKPVIILVVFLFNSVQLLVVNIIILVGLQLIILEYQEIVITINWRIYA